MRIGIGVTTYNRPECLTKWKEQIARHTRMDNILIYIAEDTDHDRKGVAARKNECLRALKDCDHIFLFDDDCWPIKDGWVDVFVGSGHPHLLFMNPKVHGRLSEEEYLDCGGVFMYMTKWAVDKVGAFNEKFVGWGFEHAEYSARIYGKKHYYIMLANTDKYIYSEDYSNPNHKSSISEVEKKIFFEANLPAFMEPIKQTYIPL